MSLRIICFFNKNKVLCDSFLGLDKIFSSVRAVLKLTKSIKKKIDEGYQVWSVYLHLNEAFDIVNHKTLVHKLNCMGIRGIFGDLINFNLSKLSNSLLLGRNFLGLHITR